MSKGVIIRRATTVDGADLREIRLLALRDEPDAYGSTYEESVKFDGDQWSRMAGEFLYFLAYDGDRPIGMSSGGRFPPRPEARWLYGMFVHIDHRGTGVATELVRAVANWARDEGTTTLGLHVTTSLPRARAFYTKLGFVASGAPSPMDRDHSLKLQTMITDLSHNDVI